MADARSFRLSSGMAWRGPWRRGLALREKIVSWSQRQRPWHAMPVVVSLLVAACGETAIGDYGGSDRASIEAAPAYDPTASCLETDGPIVRVAAVDTESTFERLTWDPGTVFDARGAIWRSHWMKRDTAQNCFPVMLGASWGACPPNRLDLYSGRIPVPDLAPPMCLVGGTIVGTQSLTASWRDVKYSAGMAVALNALRPIVEGLRIHNAEDAFVPYRSRDFVIRGNWVTYTRDDCIENDAFASGVVVDNLFDGCYVFYSARNTEVAGAPVAPGGGPDGSVVIRDNLVALRNMPGPYKSPKHSMGFGAAFKAGDLRAPRLALHRNVFLIEQPSHSGHLSFQSRGLRLGSCSDNTIVWLGEGEFPGSYPEDCFTVTTDIFVWDQARRNWIAQHSLISRLPGDAATDDR